MSDIFKVLQRTTNGLSGLGEFAPAIVGSVDEGAIIERGSNVNGEYIKLADGTQVCWIDYNVIRNVFINGDHTGILDLVRFPIPFTFPAMFSRNITVITSGGQNQTNYGWTTAESVSNTGFNLTLFAAGFDTLTQIICSYIAMGNWK